jgi:prefoldin subunit 5
MSEENRFESSDAAAGETEAEAEMTTPMLEAEAQPRTDAWPEEPAPPARVVPKAPKPVTRARVFWTAFGLGLLFSVLAVAVSLGILAAYNGGLWYAHPNRVATISRQVDGLTVQTDLLGQDLEGLRARLDNLAGLSGRIEEVEATTGQVQTDVAALQSRLAELEGLDQRVEAVQAAADQLQTEVDRLQSGVLDLGSKVDTLQQRGDRFQGFLEGLRDLLAGLFPKEAGQ